MRTSRYSVNRVFPAYPCYTAFCREFQTGLEPFAQSPAQGENDKKQWHPMLDQAESNRQSVGIEEYMEMSSADTGYRATDSGG